MNTVTTRLFPDLKFRCFGTIVRVTAAAVNRNGGQTPKLQIWRENDTQPGIYYNKSSGIVFKWPNPPCYQSSFVNRVFQCTLMEEDRISVQPGDFIGLEIPPINDDDLEIHFEAGGPTNLVFLYQLDSTVDLSTEPHFVTYDEPQINFLVVLGKKMLSIIIVI